MRLLHTLVASALVVVFLSDTITGELSSQSCMAHRLYKAGIPHIKALKYERNMLAPSLTEKSIISTPVYILQHLLKSDLSEAKNIQDCIAKRSDRCRDFEPCQNNGECHLNSAKNAYACICAKDYRGRYCSIPHLAPVGEFRAMQKVVANLQSQNEQFGKMLKDTKEKLNKTEEKFGVKLQGTQEKLKKMEEKLKLQYLGKGCNRRTLGYRYHSTHNRRQEQEHGSIASMTFRKKYANTVLRLTYSSNIRVFGSRHATARWYFLIDGQECRTPTKVDIAVHNGNGGSNHNPAVLLGICEATNTGPIGKGDHTISVNVGDVPRERSGDRSSNWESTSLMEIQEMCPQF